MPAWQKRRIGRTGLAVTALGVGTATLGASRIDVTRDGQRSDYAYDVIHLRAPANTQIPAVIDTLLRQPGIAAVRWHEVA